MKPPMLIERDKVALARYVAESLFTMNEEPTISRMMAYLRDGMNQVVPEERRRYIGGPSKVPWMEELVRFELDSLTKGQDKPQISAVTTAPPPVNQDRDDLILDALTVLQSKQEEILKRLDNITAQLSRLRRKKTPTPTQPARQFRIVVIGTESMSQYRADIERVTVGMADTTLIDCGSVSALSIPKRYDAVVIHEWVGGHFRQNIMRAWVAAHKNPNMVKETRGGIGSIKQALLELAGAASGVTSK